MSAGTADIQRVQSIHYLRAVAAMMVVVIHLFVFGALPGLDQAPFEWLKYGYSLFFVISGFVMVASTERSPVTPLAFAQRRFVRVVPFWWVMLTVWIVVGAQFDRQWLVDSYLLLPSFDPVTGASRQPVLGPGWTLVFEIAFYALFGCALVLSRRLRVWGLAIFLLLVSRATQWFEMGPYLNYYCSPIMAEFALGMLVAHCRVRLHWFCMVIGFVMLALLEPLNLDRMLAVSFPAVLIVAGARSLDGRPFGWRFADRMGDASYAIYLSHIFVITIIKGTVTPLGVPVLSAVCGIGGSVALGLIVHRVVEKPLIAALRSSAGMRRQDAIAQTFAPGSKAAQ